jgi:2,4-dienoyl-CoA reductase-like NADH-dependent reductase (Old Yellow Enzyme family)
MPTLFDPITLGAVEAPNRILMVPMTRARGTRDHVPTPMMADYYAQRASAGLIISEAIGITQGTVKRLGVRCWAGYDRPSFWLAGDQGWGGFCAWWKSGLKVPAEAST